MVIPLNKRDVFFDIAKGIGIILVIWGHTICPISQYIYEFHIPFFFIIAGYFHKREADFKEFIRKKTNRLIIPYLLFSLIAYLFYLTWGFIFKNAEVLAIWSILKIIPYKDCVIAPLWFFISLFEVSIIFWWLRKIISNSYLLLIISFVVTVLGYLLSLYRFNYFHIGSSFSMMFFYCFGSVLLKQNRKSIFSESILKNILLFVPVLFLFIFFSKYSTGIDINTNFLKAPLPVYLLNALSGSYLVLLFSSIVNTKPFSPVLSYIGKNSLVVFAIHFPMFEIARPFANLLFVRESTIWGIGLTLLCLVFSLFAAEILHRVFPKIL